MFFDREYFGPRWIYALRSRPAMLATCPEGRIHGADKSHPDWPFGTIEYASPLSDKEIYDYELEQLRPLPVNHVQFQLPNYRHGRSEYIVKNDEIELCSFFSNNRCEDIIVLEGDQSVLQKLVDCRYLRGTLTIRKEN